MTNIVNAIGTRLALALMLALAITLLAACGGDDADNSAAGADDGQVQADGDDHADDADDHAAGGEMLAAEADVVLDLELNDFAFAPAQLTIEAGKVVQFDVENTGFLHDFTIEEIDADLSMNMPETGDHVGMEGMNPDMHFAFTEPGHGVVQVRVHEPGTYAFYCSVPGHRELGMEGTLIVEAADTAARPAGD